MLLTQPLLLQKSHIHDWGKRILARAEMMGNAYDTFKALRIRPPDLLKEIA